MAYNLKRGEWHLTSAPLISEDSTITDDALRAVQRARELSDENGPVYWTVRAVMSTTSIQKMDILVTRA